MSIGAHTATRASVFIDLQKSCPNPIVPSLFTPPRTLRTDLFGRTRSVKSPFNPAQKGKLHFCLGSTGPFLFDKNL